MNDKIHGCVVVASYDTAAGPCQLDCTRCGACCTGWSVDIDSPADLRGLRACERRDRYSYTVFDEPRHDLSWRGTAYVMRMIKTRSLSDRMRCAALRGTVGRMVSCRVYNHRPGVCRAFRRGSGDYQEARENAGLVTIAVKQRTRTQTS